MDYNTLYTLPYLEKELLDIWDSTITKGIPCLRDQQN